MMAKKHKKTEDKDIAQKDDVSKDNNDTDAEVKPSGTPVNDGQDIGQRDNESPLRPLSEMKNEAVLFGIEKKKKKRLEYRDAKKGIVKEEDTTNKEDKDGS